MEDNKLITHSELHAELFGTTNMEDNKLITYGEMKSCLERYDNDVNLVDKISSGLNSCFVTFNVPSAGVVKIWREWRERWHVYLFDSSNNAYDLSQTDPNFCWDGTGSYSGISYVYIDSTVINRIGAGTKIVARLEATGKIDVGSCSLNPAYNGVTSLNPVQLTALTYQYTYSFTNTGLTSLTTSQFTFTNEIISSYKTWATSSSTVTITVPTLSGQKTCKPGNIEMTGWGVNHKTLIIYFNTNIM